MCWGVAKRFTISVLLQPALGLIERARAVEGSHRRLGGAADECGQAATVFCERRTEDEDAIRFFRLC